MADTVTASSYPGIQREKREDERHRVNVTETISDTNFNGEEYSNSETGFSLLQFVHAELTRGCFLERNKAKYAERREKVYACMRIPTELEKLMIFGFFLCLDAFLYIFTLLPLRVFLAFVRLLTLPCWGLSSRLLPSQVCDILKAFVLLVCHFMIYYVDYSMVYHMIRGQSVIKLYVIYNMLEVGDRLFSSVGLDILDSLYWTATEPKERKRAHLGVIPHFIMAVLYVFLHSILIMVQATSLNVAFNSHNKSLLTIMMSSNFVEIKGSVFKKFEKKNLFHITNSDIKGRFTNYIILFIVCLRNMEQFSWNPGHLWDLFPDVCMLITAEVAVDIVKHAFITKFNHFTASVYGEYRARLAFDLLSSRRTNACADYSDAVCRRIGFIPLPLAVLLTRVLTSSLKVQGPLSFVCALLFYLGMVNLKVLNSIILLGKSCLYVREAKMEEKVLLPPAQNNFNQPGKDVRGSINTQPLPVGSLLSEVPANGPNRHQNASQTEEAVSPQDHTSRAFKKDLLERHRIHHMCQSN